MLPNFSLAGTSRSGTTSLYYYLRQHPDICFPDKKEPKYFSSIEQKFPHHGPGDQNVDKIMIRDFKTYLQLFDGYKKCKFIGDASSDYLYFHRHSAAEMRRVLGDIPIILCLRNPVERAYSAYTNLVRDQREMLSFSSALEQEDKRLADNWDWMWGYKDGGLYADQVKTFLDIFSQVKVVLFEDLKHDADAVVRDIFSFLGVDERVKVDTSTRYSQSGKAKNRLVAFLSNRENKVAFTLRQIVLKFVPRAVLENIASRSLQKDEMEAEVRTALQEYYESDVKLLESLLGRSLDVWR